MVEAALEALAEIDDVIVTQSSDARTIRLSGSLSNTVVPLLQADAKSPTDGTLAQTLSLDYDVASRMTSASDDVTDCNLESDRFCCDLRLHLPAGLFEWPIGVHRSRSNRILASLESN